MYTDMAEKKYFQFLSVIHTLGEISRFIAQNRETMAAVKH